MTDDDGPRADGPRADEPRADGPVPEENGPTADDRQARGTIRYQDAESTSPRPPTLAEQRARERAEQQRQEQEAEAARRMKRRRRVMIGGGATIGVVALLATIYATASESDTYTASCVATDPDNGQVIHEPDAYCDENYVRTHGGYYDSAHQMWLMPFLFSNGRFGRPVQYRYSYSSGDAVPGIGQTISHPNYTSPSSGTVKTSSGQTISRGGFGVSGKSGSGS